MRPYEQISLCRRDVLFCFTLVNRAFVNAHYRIEEL